MFQRFLVLLFLINLFSCKKELKKEVDLTALHATPYNASFILQVNDKNTFVKKLNKQSLKLVFNEQIARKIPTIISANNSINATNNLLLACTGNNFNILAISKIANPTAVLDTVKLNSNKITDYNNVAIHKINQLDEDYFFAKYKSLLLASYSRLLIENAIRQLDEKENIAKDSLFIKAYNTIDTSNFANLLVNNTATDLVQLNPFNFENTTRSNSTFTSWTALDIVANKEQLILNGISLTDDINNYINSFSDAIGHKHSITNYTPSSITNYKGIAINDFKKFKRKLDLLGDSKHNNLIDSILPILEETAIFQLANAKILALKTTDFDKTKELLITETKIESQYNYRGELINQLAQNDLFQSFLSPFIQLDDVQYYYQKETVFFFAKTKNDIQKLIANQQNNNLLLQNESLKKTFKELGDNTLLLAQKSTKNIVLDQYNYTDGIAYVNVLINPKISRANSLKQQNIQTSNTIQAKPYFFTNFKTHKKQLIVTKKNNITLLTATGKTQWSKKIDGEIVADIQEIDIYKNNKIQLLFATQNYIYCLDLNGNKVAGFPIKIKGIQSLTLFDYDKNKNYRIVVSTKKEIILYNVKGKKLSGFSYKCSAKINSIPKHFRSFKKDYIVFTDKKGELHILNRRGKNRTTIKEHFKFSDNPLYFNERFIVFTDTKGNEIQVNIASGKVTKKALGLPKKHFVYTDKHSFITVDENVLKINAKMINLPLGDYQKPIVVKGKKGLRVLILNKAKNEIFCYNSKGTLQAHFPVYGKSFINVTSNGNQFLLVTQENENNLILYQF